MVDSTTATDQSVLGVFSADERAGDTPATIARAVVAAKIVAIHREIRFMILLIQRSQAGGCETEKMGYRISAGNVTATGPLSTRPMEFDGGLQIAGSRPAKIANGR
ncbi:hypothetical protein GCM10009765_73400 [Fodinicola feengrottensis]|uniref:Uncharacterized protein n=1 Tax=Fodinicola feengrottensis TaxID=435914 RepID=A0ABN2IX71_9ACTN